MKKRMLIVVTVIIAFVIFNILFLKFPIPFITSMIAKYHIKNHLQVDDIELVYNLKTNSYEVLNRNSRVSYNPLEKTIFDEELNSNLNKKADRLYANFLKTADTNVKFPDTICLYTQFAADDIKKKEQKIYILGIWERKTFDNEEKMKTRMYDLMSNIINGLGNEFNITSIQFNYACLNGLYKLNIDSRSGLKELPKDVIVNKIECFKEEELGEEYLKWKKNSNEK